MQCWASGRVVVREDAFSVAFFAMDRVELRHLPFAVNGHKVIVIQMSL